MSLLSLRRGDPQLDKIAFVDYNRNVSRRSASWLFSQGTANNSQETAMFSAVIRRALPL
jgi:hypothetical protein